MEINWDSSSSSSDQENELPLIRCNVKKGDILSFGDEQCRVTDLTMSLKLVDLDGHRRPAVKCPTQYWSLRDTQVSYS